LQGPGAAPFLAARTENRQSKNLHRLSQFPQCREQEGVEGSTGRPESNAASRNAWRTHLAGVRQAIQVRAGGTIRRITMHEFDHAFSTTLKEFHAVSKQELEKVDGGSSVVAKPGQIFPSIPKNAIDIFFPHGKIVFNAR
jgi:hypothetical protein